MDERHKLVYDRMVTTSKPQVDYNRIAPTYDCRFADGGQPGIAAALRALALELDAGRILEVGCGTGHWLSGLARTGAQAWGLDLSPGMLARARQRGAGFRLSLGRAGRLPYADAAFDLVYCVNAIHHFDEQPGFIHEARRVLRPGGALAVVGMDPHTSLDAWYVYDFFEGTRQGDLARFASWGTILDWMVQAGFSEARWRCVDKIHDPKVGRAVFDDPFLQKDACSQLTLLEEEAYAAGLRRIEAALARAEARGESLVFPSDITTAMLSGWVPTTTETAR